MAQLKVSHISKAFDDQEILKDVTLELRDNELVSLLGVSGGGKTTLFNVISGLLKPEEGQVFLDGKDITGQPGNVSYMLQKDLLLPYRTIEDNVALPLIIKGEKKKEARKKPVLIFRNLDWKEQKKSIQASFPEGCAKGQLICGPICFQTK